MKTYIHILLIALIGFVSMTTASAQNGGLVVVVNNNNTAVTEMSTGQVKLYFLKKIKIRWPQINKAIKPAEHREMTPIRQLFYSKVLKMSQEDVGQYFVERQISNAIKPPVKLDSDQKIIEYVQANEGAIAYISRTAYESNKSKVKAVLMINQ